MTDRTGSGVGDGPDESVGDESDETIGGDPDGSARADGGESADDGRTHTVRLELKDSPGELLRALSPIADAGGNLLSIHHERGAVTPSGRIPVEVALECPPGRFDDVVAGLREAGVTVVRAGTERYDDEIAVVLSGHVVETDLSETLSRIESATDAAVVDLSLSAPGGVNGVSSARLRLAVDSGAVDEALSTIREVGAEKDLVVVEPLVGGGA